MALTQAGRQFTADQVQQTAGDLAALIRDSVQRGMNFKVQLESWPDAELVDLGLTLEEINAIKGFFVGADGVPAIAAVVQANVWIKQLLGTGV